MLVCSNCLKRIENECNKNLYLGPCELCSKKGGKVTFVKGEDPLYKSDKDKIAIMEKKNANKSAKTKSTKTVPEPGDNGTLF